MFRKTYNRTLLLLVALRGSVTLMLTLAFYGLTGVCELLVEECPEWARHFCQGTYY